MGPAHGRGTVSGPSRQQLLLLMDTDAAVARQRAMTPTAAGGGWTLSHRRERQRCSVLREDAETWTSISAVKATAMPEIGQPRFGACHCRPVVVQARGLKTGAPAGRGNRFEDDMAELSGAGRADLVGYVSQLDRVLRVARPVA